MARVLGADGLGIYAAMLALLTIYSLPLEFGLPALITREVARGIQSGNLRQIKGLIYFSLLFIILFFPLLAILASVTFYISPWAQEILQIPYWWLLMGYIFFNGFGSVSAAFLAGSHAIISAQFSALVFRPLIFLGILLAWHLHSDEAVSLSVALWGQVLSVAASSCLCFYILLRQFVKRVNGIHPSFEISRWIKSAWKLGLINGIRRGQPQILVYLLSLLVASESVGLFRVAQRGASLVAFGASVVTTTAMPYISSMLQAGDMARLQGLLSNSARIMCLWAVLCFVGAVIFGKLLLGAVFGSAYIATYWPFVIFCLIEVFKAYYGMSIVVLNMGGHESESLKLMSINLVISLLGTLILAPYLGVIGCALSCAIASLLVYWRANFRAMQISGLDSRMSLPWRRVLSD